MFQKATKAESRLRLNLEGPSGSGKSFTSLLIGTFIAKKCKGKLAYIDTERGSASKYSDEFNFDVVELHTDQSPQAYIDKIHEAEKAGYPVLIIDSLSHAWSGKGGALEMVDNISARSRSNNKWAAWRHVTPQHNALIDAILASPCHIISTLRVKTEWITETNEKGRAVPKKVGLAPIMRDGIEYEFDISGEIDLDHILSISKTRCRALNDKVFRNPGEDFAEVVWEWLTVGVDPKRKFAPPPVRPPPASPTSLAPPAPAPESSKPTEIDKNMVAKILSEYSQAFKITDINLVRQNVLKPLGGLSLGEINASKYPDLVLIVQELFSKGGMTNPTVLDAAIKLIPA
jgi:hypothetical protein